MDKDSIRRMIWRLLEERGVARFPRPIYGRIPNFDGSYRAALILAGTKPFMSSSLIKINPDSPQKPLRLMALRMGKSVLMPTPRLRRGFILLDPSRIPRRLLEQASTIKGAFRFGTVLDTLDKLLRLPKVDLVVAGSVAVSPRGGERLGKGGGYSELEYAILRELGLVGESTPVATTVHELQLVERIPFERHDVSVDLIATNRRLIRVGRPRPRPKGIIWDLLGEDRISSIPLLSQLRAMAKG